MQENEELNPAERELADALGSLKLAPVDLSERAVWYEAGVSAGRRKAGLWRAIAAAVIAATGLRFGWEGLRTGPVQKPAVAVVAADSATSMSADYLRLCNEVIREGIGGREHLAPHSDWRSSDNELVLPDAGVLLHHGDGT